MARGGYPFRGAVHFFQRERDDRRRFSRFVYMALEMTGAPISFQTSRYLIYPQLLLASVGLLGWLKLQRVKYKTVSLGLIAAAILHVYSGNFAFGKLGFRRTAHRAMAYPYYHTDPRTAKAIADEACEEGIYCLKTKKQLLSSE